MPRRNARSKTVRRALRTVGLARRPRPLAAEQRWGAYLRVTEPAVAAQPRVHRFAQVPLLGDPGTAAQPLAVWIEGEGEDAAATRRALESSTLAPAAVLDGPLDQALAGTRAEWVLLLRGGDVPAPLALERLGQAATLAPDADVLTCDEDELDAAGRRGAPRFRPGPSPDRWLACDDSSRSLLVRRGAAAGALPAVADAGAAWRHALAMSLASAGGERAAHVPMLLSHRRAGSRESSLAPDLVRRLIGGNVQVQSGEGDVRRVHRPLLTEASVEVIVCLRDKPELLRRCVDSLLARTAYQRLAVALVDNGSQDPVTLELLGAYEGDPRIRVLQDPRPFNFAALNNAAARTSTADVLVFLNNDTETVDSVWIEALLEEALRPEVGAVAPMLLYPEGPVQHAGAALGLHGYAGHPFAGLAPSQPTPFGRADGGTRNWLAVTAACLMVERAKFEAVNAFDDSFVVAGNDVDLCLRLTAAGHRSLCVPHATVLHDESRSRGEHIDPADFVRSEQSYGRFRTVGDPFYNPNLTLDATDCGVRVPGNGLR